MPKLTIQSVKSMRPTASRREIPDTLCPGLYLVVQPKGAKSWAVRYRFNGKPCKVTLGAYPKIPLTESNEARKARLAKDPKSEVPGARGIARAMLAAVATGRNPANEKKEARAKASSGDDDEHLMQNAWKKYTDVYLPHDKKAKASSIARFKAIFETHVLPKWKNRKVDEITKDDILSARDKAEKRGPYASNSTVTVLSAFFNWCCKEGHLIEDSPAKNVRKLLEESKHKRKRKLSDEEVKTFWKGCDELGFVFGPMFQMLLLTGARRNEVAGMTHGELDLENRIWTIPGTRTKNGEEHKIYLSDATLAIIKSLPRIEGCKYLFSTNGDSPSSGYSKAKRQLDKKTPDLAPYRIHDLRRTFATGCAKLKIPVTVTEKALNHSSGTLDGIVEVYQQYDYAEETKAAFIAWGNFVVRLVNDKTAKIIPIHSERKRQNSR